jgi:hypothetical protein
MVTSVLEAAQGPAATLPRSSRRRYGHRLLLIVVLAVVAAGVAGLVSGGRSVAATGPYTAQVSWPAVTGAAAIRIELNRHLIDQVSTDGAGSYDLHGLWPATSFRVDIDVLDARGRVLARYPRRVRTARARGPFPRLYSADAFINRPISPAPRLAHNSRAMVADALESKVETATFSNNERWGIPIVYAGQQSALSRVRCLTYGCFFGTGSVRIPAGAQPNTGTDHHLVVLQPDDKELDLWVGLHIGNSWSAGTRWVESASGPAANCLSATRCGGANAAYFALGAGLVRPEEIAQGHIDHALAITTPITRRGYVACPAGHGDGRHDDPNALPIGAHVQLDPSLNVAALPLPRWQKVIAVALQRYGAYVVDTGGAVAFYAQSNLGRGFDAWDKAGVPADSPSVSDLPWSSMRVLAMTRCAG